MPINLMLVLTAKCWTSRTVPLARRRRGYPPVAPLITLCRCWRVSSHPPSLQVVIIVGETGSGKTTQMTQYLHEGGFTQWVFFSFACVCFILLLVFFVFHVHDDAVLLYYILVVHPINRRFFARHIVLPLRHPARAALLETLPLCGFSPVQIPLLSGVRRFTLQILD